MNKLTISDGNNTYDVVFENNGSMSYSPNGMPYLNVEGTWGKKWLDNMKSCGFKVIA